VVISARDNTYLEQISSKKTFKRYYRSENASFAISRNYSVRFSGPLNAYPGAERSVAFPEQRRLPSLVYKAHDHSLPPFKLRPFFLQQAPDLHQEIPQILNQFNCLTNPVYFGHIPAPSWRWFLTPSDSDTYSH